MTAAWRNKLTALLHHHIYREYKTLVISIVTGGLGPSIVGKAAKHVVCSRWVRRGGGRGCVAGCDNVSELPFTLALTPGAQEVHTVFILDNDDCAGCTRLRHRGVQVREAAGIIRAHKDALPALP